ncbi:hypothetical protein LUCX_240 [Xanthomonas phage vB_XciM_LucasX]|nr:hypothetical protein LUCX_240 [Xanthomonas phage vB_XciM_LucasX]
MSQYACSKIRTITHCTHCAWCQDIGRTFRKKHKFLKAPKRCPLCDHALKRTIGQFIYRQITSLLGLGHRWQVKGFVEPEQITQFGVLTTV